MNRPNAFLSYVEYILPQLWRVEHLRWLRLSTGVERELWKDVDLTFEVKTDIEGLSSMLIELP